MNLSYSLFGASSNISGDLYIVRFKYLHMNELLLKFSLFKSETYGKYFDTLNGRKFAGTLQIC